MLKEMEYLGFAMRSPEGVSMYVFDVTPDGVMTYGPFAVDDAIGKRTTMEEAVMVTIRFEDGTMPIPLSEFSDRIKAGETWDNGVYNMFPKTVSIGVGSLFSDRLKKKVPLHMVKEQEGEEFFVEMFEQCIECHMRYTQGAKKKVVMFKARRVFNEYLGDMEKFFEDEDTYYSFEGLIIDLLDEAYNTADPKLVKFILEQNDKLEKKGVPMERRPARISRAAAKKCRDDFAEMLFPRNKKAKKSV